MESVTCSIGLHYKIYDVFYSFVSKIKFCFARKRDSAFWYWNKVGHQFLAFILNPGGASPDFILSQWNLFYIKRLLAKFSQILTSKTSYWALISKINSGGSSGVGLKFDPLNLEVNFQNSILSEYLWKPIKNLFCLYF